MKITKRKKLQAAGWKTGSASDFLKLSEQEEKYIEMKLALSAALKKRRIKQKLNQIELAQLLESSQSRVAKMEAGDPGVSIDLLMKSLMALGASPKELAKTIAAS